MSKKKIYFIALFFVALALGPALAHLLELPNKINLAREDYLTVQQIYRGWALLGIVVGGALLSTLAVAVKVRKERKAFVFALLAFLCIVGTQVVFWTYTYPANQATNNWTMLPENWRASPGMGVLSCDERGSELVGAYRDDSLGVGERERREETANG